MKGRVVRPARGPFREGPNPAEALAMDQQLFDRPGAFGLFFDIPEPMVHDPADVVDGVAVLRLSGPIEHHSSWLWHSYEDLALQVECALIDSNVQVLVLKIDSPGGVAAGMHESHKAIRRLRREYGKPIIAYIDEQACSAAYHVASACDEIWMPESAQVGSVGVILCTIDETEALEKAGLRVRYVVTGKRKADLHPGQPVDDEVLRVAQEKVDYLGALFFRAVGKARGLAPEDVEGLQAAVFYGPKAIAEGLADEVASWPKFLRLATELAQSGTVAQPRGTVPSARTERSMERAR